MILDSLSLDYNLSKYQFIRDNPHKALNKIIIENIKGLLNFSNIIPCINTIKFENEGYIKYYAKEGKLTIKNAEITKSIKIDQKIRKFCISSSIIPNNNKIFIVSDIKELYWCFSISLVTER